VIDQTQKYTTEGCESSGRGDMLRAIVLVREATQLLKSKATHLPDCGPGTRLQKIAIGLGEFSDSLERAAIAIERGHHRKSSRASKGELDLPGLEALITKTLRHVPLGSRKGRQLFALRNRVRGILSSGSLSGRTEHIGTAVRRELAKRNFAQQAGGAA
jgi:hypothetical protein